MTQIALSICNSDAVSLESLNDHADQFIRQMEKKVGWKQSDFIQKIFFCKEDSMYAQLINDLVFRFRCLNREVHQSHGANPAALNQDMYEIDSIDKLYQLRSPVWRYLRDNPFESLIDLEDPDYQGI